MLREQRTGITGANNTGTTNRSGGPDTCVGVLCYSLTPATVELLNAIREGTGLRLQVFVLYPVGKPVITPRFRYVEPVRPPRFVAFSGRIPESHVALIGGRLAWVIATSSDIVLLFGIQGIPAFLTAVFAKIRRKPIIVASQMMPYEAERRRSRLLRAAKAVVLRAATLHVAQTETTRVVLEHLYGIPRGAIRMAPFTGGARTVIEMLARVPARDEVREHLRISVDAVVFLFVGTLLYLKGVDILVEAFARLAPKFPNAVLLIAGPDGAASGMLANLKRMVGRLRLENKVRFLGELPFERIAELYRAADVLVLPSRKDVWPKVVLEASLAGLPSIVTRVTGVAGSLIIDGVSGLVIPDNNTEVLAKAMERLMEPQERIRMGSCAREYALAYTDMTEEIRGYTNAIMEVLRNRSRLVTDWGRRETTGE